MHSRDSLAGRIHLIRGVQVILDSDLAKLYGVETRRLNEQVRRNCLRFPPEFVFRLSNQELVRLMSQFATSNVGRGGLRKPPFAFTEHGAILEILQALRQLTQPAEVPKRRRIGFVQD